MDRHPDAVVQGADHPHQPVQGEASEVHVSDTREVRGREPGHARRLPHAEAALVQYGDDPGRKDGFGLLQIGLGVSEVAKDIAASLDQFDVLKRRTLAVIRVSILSGFKQTAPPGAGNFLVQAASNRSTTIRSARLRACHRS